jgi:hypothetical protein
MTERCSASSKGAPGARRTLRPHPPAEPSFRTDIVPQQNSCLSAGRDGVLEKYRGQPLGFQVAEEALESAGGPIASIV